MKKKIIVDGKEYILKETPETTEETTEEEESEETTEETTEEVAEEEESEDEDFEEVTDEVATKIATKLGLDKLESIALRIEKATKQTSKTDKTKMLGLESAMKKDSSEMTSREKILTFFKALMSDDQVTMKALNEGTPADGGYLFPNEFRNEIVRDIEETSHMRNLVRVLPMSRDILNAPSVGDGPKVTWTEENAVKSTTTTRFGQITLTAKKMAAIQYISDELIDDSNQIDVVDLIIQLFAEAVGAEEDRVIVAGNGTTEPTGIITSGTVGTRTVAGNLGFDDIIDLEYDLPAKYMINAVYLVNRNNIRELRKLKDTTGRYLWQDPIAAGQPATFHGKPVIEENNMPDSQIVLGDLKRAYWMGDRQKMTVKISNDTTRAFTQDMTAIRVVERIAGNIVLAPAVKKLISIP